MQQLNNWPKGCLSEKEWRELVALEYVLIWGYSDNEQADENRYRYLSNIRWNSIYKKNTPTHDHNHKQ